MMSFFLTMNLLIRARPLISVNRNRDDCALVGLAEEGGGDKRGE
jgi:hypothetical protein